MCNAADMTEMVCRLTCKFVGLLAVKSFFHDMAHLSVCANA